MSASHSDAIGDLRLRLLANGYEPLPIIAPSEPVKSAGKRPRLDGWRAMEITPGAVRAWSRDYPRDINTGIRCGQIIGLDVDILDTELVEEVEQMAVAMLGATPLRRIGRAPKLLLAYRAAELMAKAETPEFFFPDGQKAQVEVLAGGQQFVSHGTHPETRQPYVWTHLAPEEVQLADLPAISTSRIRAFLAAAGAVIRERGGRTAKEMQPTPEPRPARPAATGNGGGFFREVNTRALADCDAWVRQVFPRARWQPNGATPPGAWRVASEDLGRGLEEDISIHPIQGCQDFGTREAMTPIDLVMQHMGAPDATKAALWLCDVLRVDPAALGWKGGKGKQEAPPQRSMDGDAVVMPPSQKPAGKGEAPLPLIYFGEVAPCLDAADFVEGVLTEEAMSVVYGPSNCGKTFFVSDLALHVATGKAWRGREIEAGGVIYCALEGAHGIANRVAAWRAHYGYEGVQVPFAVVPVSINLLDPDADRARLVATIAIAAVNMGVPVKLIVIDTLSRAMAGGNENGPEDMGALVASADFIRQACKAHICFIHHSGKDEARGARGHSLLRAATDTEIEISRQDSQSPSVARVTKQREMEIEGEFVFKLATMELGTNRRGKPVTSCVVEVVECEAAPKQQRKAAKLPDGAQIALDSLSQAIGEHGARRTHASLPPGILTVMESEWRRAFYARLGDDPAETKKKAYQRATAALQGRRVAIIQDGFAWVVRQEASK
jgi:hypothetical protein